MKRLLCFFCLVVSLQALKVDISYGKEKNTPFSTITLTNQEAFGCEYITKEGQQSSFVQCVIDSVPENGFLPFDTNFFEFSYQMIDKKFTLMIKAKKNQKLFFIPDGVQDSGFFGGNRGKKSKTWQIIGYEKEIPFLSSARPRGINFPITITGPKYSYMSEIDVDKKPIVSSLGTDYAEYLKIKDFVETGSYRPALNAIANAFKKYPNTPFAKDLLFFQIKALYHLKRYDSVIDYGDNWIKHYASDIGVPEILYILGKTYTHLKFPTESMYYYRRVIDEYPEDRFTPLAKMKIADYLAQGTNIGLARVYFSQAYQETKNIDDAVEIAIEWAEFEIQNKHPQDAQELLEKILKANPKFFVHEQDKTIRLLAFLSENNMYKAASMIAQYFSDHINKDEVSHEKVLFLLGIYYEKSQQFDKAHEANLKYLKFYENLPGAKDVVLRDDSLLFKVSGSDKEKIERYDYILKKYSGSEQAQKAAILKAELLIQQKAYQDVLKMKNILPKDNKLYNQALALLVNQDLENNSCAFVSQYLAELVDFEYIDNKMKVFDCLYALHFNLKASDLAQSQMQDKNSKDYLPWLYRYAKNLYKLGKYQDSILAAKDVLSIAKSKNEKQYNDILFTLFNDLMRSNSAEAIKVYGQLEEEFGNDKRMMQVYFDLLNQKSDINASKLIYATKLYELQKQHQTKDFTPFVEFALIESLKQNNDLKAAYEVASKLANEEIKNNDKQKALYVKADLEIKMGDKKKAAETLKQCVDVKDATSWKTLCEQSKDLLKE